MKPAIDHQGEPFEVHMWDEEAEAATPTHACVDVIQPQLTLWVWESLSEDGTRVE